MQSYPHPNNTAKDIHRTWIFAVRSLRRSFVVRANQALPVVLPTFISNKVFRTTFVRFLARETTVREEAGSHVLGRGLDYDLSRCLGRSYIRHLGFFALWCFILNHTEAQAGTGAF